MDKALPAEPPHYCPHCKSVMQYIGTQTSENGWSVSTWRCDKDRANLSVETNLYHDDEGPSLGKEVKP